MYCQLLPNSQRTHRTKSFYFSTDLFLLLPALVIIRPWSWTSQGRSPGADTRLAEQSPQSQRGNGNTPGLPSPKVSMLAPHTLATIGFHEHLTEVRMCSMPGPGESPRKVPVNGSLQGTGPWPATQFLPRRNEPLPRETPKQEAPEPWGPFCCSPPHSGRRGLPRFLWALRSQHRRPWCLPPASHSERLGMVSPAKEAAGDAHSEK